MSAWRSTSLSLIHILHEGDVVYVSGKLAGLLGRVAAVDYNFRIRLADYERVIGAADRNVRGTFYVFGSHMLTLDHGALPYAQDVYKRQACELRAMETLVHTRVYGQAPAAEQ